MRESTSGRQRSPPPARQRALRCPRACAASPAPTRKRPCLSYRSLAYVPLSGETTVIMPQMEVIINDQRFFYAFSCISPARLSRASPSRTVTRRSFFRRHVNTHRLVQVSHKTHVTTGG
ncbi:hypothetical protein KCP74_12605 [Salmonella enterica subsp. enterica]|nr:hypothetical protein KCP74_12605 [Salmonella enterica subsp. enterica]